MISLQKALAIGTFITIGFTNASQKVCRALVMSGGANKGAYEAGVIYGLAHELNPEDVAYDVLSGVSAGALNAGALSVWDKMDTVKSSEWLVDIWMSLTNDQVYKNWEGGLAHGFYNESGVLDNSPLF